LPENPGMQNKILIFFLPLFLASCAQKTGIHLQNGDLLFIGNSSGGLSKAIDEVTQTNLKTNYSHIALVEKSGNDFWVLHSTPENGSERISLKKFLENQKKENADVDVYRIKNPNQIDFESAINKAKTMLGKPYNFTYVLSDSAYYCSDFVYHSFEKDSVFKLNPMTFKNPGKTEFNQGWIDFYGKLNMKIPEGEPGCNPNGMAASEKIEFIGRLN
jgi:uncharacterized protein YycO